MAVLRAPEISRPAEPLRNSAFRSIIYQARIDGGTL